jgi:hypothetical protein
MALEHQVSELRELPTRVDGLRSEISQLRTTMRDEFFAIRGEMATKKDLEAIRAEMATKKDLEAIRGEMATKNDLEALRGETLLGDEETRRQMRVLHEDVIGRLTLIQEGLSTARRRKPR